MEKKTYIAPGLMDWVAQIKTGAATVKIHFGGGAITAYGVTPAEYTTSDAFMQQVIERSSYYKSGRIKVGLRETISAPEKPKTTASKPAATAQEVAVGATDKPECEPAVEATEDAPHDSYKEVAVTCLQDAQDYLQQNYGISSYKVRTRAMAQKVAMEHGIEFIGGGFLPIDTAYDTE